MVKSLGVGAMGEVVLMEDTKLDRKVAIKSMRPNPNLTSRQAIEMRQRFVREASTAGKLTHPNIVTIYDSFEAQDGAASPVCFLRPPLPPLVGPFFLACAPIRATRGDDRS